MNDLRLKHTDPTFHGVVVALAVIVIILGMIEFTRFLSASAIKPAGALIGLVGRLSRRINQRLYRPRAEILNGTWKFPEPQAVT
jgi:hypothetical protein